ncbi:transcription factor bHLH140 isoform X3 [Quercus robur]|uniref:transcription factor bHLH140 isoform X3 n=1 Tax=Quercus robur TaxID=38942 RepID=UPI002162DA99|nr:transcription factor bHLH140 isoform X3 [Quercus robur]
MEMEIDDTPKPTGEGTKGKPIVVILVGAPGSGKSTFCEQVMASSTRPWVRICQDTIGNGKSGTKSQCLKSAASALNDGKSVFIDRCNLDREQRAEFVKLGNPNVDVHAIVLDLPAKLCISRSVKRTGHEGNLQGGKAAAVVNRMLQKKEFPKLSEGFTRITFCQNESDVQAAHNTYSALGPLDTLPNGSFGQKNPDAKIQLGIMRFLKKVEVPANTVSDVNSIQSSVSHKNTEEKEPSYKGQDNISSFSGNASKELKEGDITKLYSEGGLRCNVIANAANWRLKPGGGGVNAAIFNAAGPALEVATKEQAQSLHPGKAVVVPLPSTSPLFSREGVTHVIHVLGPNMNQHRPNCLNNDYIKGCQILREAYTSLFEGFASIIRTQGKLAKVSNENLDSNPSGAQEVIEGANTKHSPNNDQKSKREHEHDYDRSKKCKGSQDEIGADIPESKIGKVDKNNDKIDGSMTKAWGSWAQALHKIAMHPQTHKDVVLEISDDVVVLNDLYPKARRHLLVLARSEGLDRLSDVSKDHLQLLKTMHDVGLKWAEKFLQEDASLIFRLGYHSVPSMRQLHLHVISQDFDSKNLKNKKHWNSFNTAFFLDSVDVLEEVSSHGKATLRDDESLLSMELRCHRCRSAHPNIPRLKSHISNCQAPFPPSLLQNSRLVLAPCNAGIDP